MEKGGYFGTCVSAVDSCSTKGGENDRSHRKYGFRGVGKKGDFCSLPTPAECVRLDSR